MENMLSGDALLPNTLTFPRYFISNSANNELLHHGTMYEDVLDEKIKVNMPRDGSFVLSVSGHNTEGGAISWNFCGVSGGLNDRLYFTMRRGFCEAVDFVPLSSSYTCENEWTSEALLLSAFLPLGPSSQLRLERKELNIMTALAVALGFVALVVMIVHWRENHRNAPVADMKDKPTYSRIQDSSA